MHQNTLDFLKFQPPPPLNERGTTSQILPGVAFANTFQIQQTKFAPGSHFVLGRTLETYLSEQIFVSVYYCHVYLILSLPPGILHHYVKAGQDGPSGNPGARPREPHERPISREQELSCEPGPPGTAGPPGPPGQRGPGGPRGYPGSQGLVGPVGVQGRPGPISRPGQRGPPGQSGRAGDPGRVGIQGIRGPPGQRGPAGIGLQGERGPSGRRGDPGPRGLNGVGRPGERGRPGQRGLNGERGPPGQRGTPGQCLCNGRKRRSALIDHRMDPTVDQHFGKETNQLLYGE